jgi:hypothetical protein
MVWYNFVVFCTVFNMRRRLLETDVDSILLVQPDLSQFRMFMRVLNWDLDRGGKTSRPNRQQFEFSTRFDLVELRRLTESWLTNGRNLNSLLVAEPALAQAAQEMETRIVPGPDGRARLLLRFRSRQAEQLDRRTSTAHLFVSFLLNPDNDRLIGRCSRCKSFIERKTLHHKIYCSRKCALMSTSKAALRKRRQKERNDNLIALRLEISRLSKKELSGSWKDYASKRAGVTKTFLTRAINSGEIITPTLRSQAS